MRVVLLKDRWLAPVGCTCLSIAVLMDRFVIGDGIIDFLIGVLIGMSIVLNLVALYRFRKS
ncbi:MAG: hypothetical protein C4K47_03640 [Candidatus Thorarchaeota archaeon]|nr:MAG: hypothetical protein C4K47_03640 [Candidatus Thorarchaeota archaeon]